MSTSAPSNNTAEKNGESRKSLLIGQLADATGRSVHTIRWYEAQRLIPGVRRDLQRRRIYAHGHIEWLDLLERLRRTGMSIKDMREYAALVKRGESSLKERQLLMKAHRERIQLMIEDLQESVQLIDTKIDFYGLWLQSGKRPPPILHRALKGKSKSK
jgi:DNA-binding transcriptional MerR regulator